MRQSIARAELQVVCSAVLTALVSLSCSDAGPQPAAEPSGRWSGDFIGPDGTQSAIEFAMHGAGDDYQLIGGIGQQVGVVGDASTVDAQHLSVSLSVFTPDFPVLQGLLRFVRDSLSGQLTYVRDSTLKSSLRLKRDHVDGGDAVGRWVMTETFRTLTPKPDTVADTMVITRGGSFGRTRSEVWLLPTFTHRCSYGMFGTYRRARDTLVLAQWTRGFSSCLTRPIDTVLIDRNRIRRRYIVGLPGDSIVESYSKR